MHRFSSTTASKKTALVIIILLTSAVCLLTVYTDVIDSGAKLASGWLKKSKSITGDEQHIIVLKTVDVIRNSGDANVTRKDSHVSGKPTGNVTTTMTFDPNLTVTCSPTKLVECKAPEKAPDLHESRTFRIALLRRPGWLSHNTYDFSSCPFSKCVYDRDKVTEQTDVVQVYGVGLRDNFPAPRRWPHQLYAVMTWESPVHTRADFLSSEKSPWNNRFNLTISYRTDSDILIPYARLKFDPKPLDQRPNYYELAKNKTKTALWYVSNCKTPSKRRKYVDEMKKYIDVDIFGGCGTPCGRDCLITHSHTYKFYLSFENSLCTDYITEKFFKIYFTTRRLIPVVRGGADYDKFFPKDTFINAAHFKSAKDLALFLKDLAADSTRYSHYLERRDLYIKSGRGIGETGCALCEYLHTRQTEHKVYNLKKWMGDGHCHAPTDLG